MYLSYRLVRTSYILVIQITFIHILLADGSGLTKGAGKGIALVQEYAAGSYKRDGAAGKGIQCGAAYIFLTQGGQWSQVAKLYPHKDLQSILQYAYDVDIERPYAVVGAPGAYNERGLVHVYKYNIATSSWDLVRS